jgi:hypothetical protein
LRISSPLPQLAIGQCLPTYWEKLLRRLRLRKVPTSVHILRSSTELAIHGVDRRVKSSALSCRFGQRATETSPGSLSVATPHLRDRQQRHAPSSHRPLRWELLVYAWISRLCRLERQERQWRNHEGTRSGEAAARRNSSTARLSGQRPCKPRTSSLRRSRSRMNTATQRPNNAHAGRASIQERAQRQVRRHDFDGARFSSLSLCDTPV